MSNPQNKKTLEAIRYNRDSGLSILDQLQVRILC